MMNGKDAHWHQAPGYMAITRGMEHRFNNGTHREADVSRLFTATTGLLLTGIIELLLKKAGLTVPPNIGKLELWTGSDWRRNFTESKDRRAIDLVVVDPTPSNVPGGEEELPPVLFIELKGLAVANGRQDYCPAADGEYSNQILCYFHECWCGPKGEGVPRMLIGPSEEQFEGAGITKGMTEKYPELQRAFEKQEEVRELWEFYKLRDFLAHLSSLPDSPGRDEVVDALSVWLDRCGL